MQPLGLNGYGRRAYFDRLFSSHDFDVAVDILSLEERPLGTARFLDGQVNLQKGALIRRTATLTLSDPEGAFDPEDAVKWATRLIRVRHSIYVPELGRRVTTVPFIGPPSAIARPDTEVTLELQDKTALAWRGSRPFTVTKGRNAVNAIRAILRETTGERRFRMPSSRRRLSKHYSVGWADDASPWKVASRIARSELGMQLIYSNDGYVLLRRKPRRPALHIPGVTELPTSSVDLTGVDNWVRVTGKQQSRSVGSGGVTATSQASATARIRPGQPLSPESLARHGEPRFWPRLVEDPALSKVWQVEQAANRELGSSDQFEGGRGIQCVPFFHGDVDDIVTADSPEGSAWIRLTDCSIPLGVSGDMSIGQQTRYSRPPKRSTWTRIRARGGHVAFDSINIRGSR